MNERSGRFWHLERSSGISKTLAQGFALDERSLGAMRLALGAVLIADLAQRMMDLSAHYTDQGVLPRSLEAQLAAAGQWSLLNLSGSSAFCAAMFGLALVSAVCLLLGWQARLAAVASWILLVSIQNRNPLVRHSGDDVLRLALFWSAFLPVGACFSLDARKGRGVMRSSVGSVCFVLQVLFLFVSLLDHKLLGQSWISGSAVAESLSVEMYQRPFGAWLARQDALLPALTWGVLLWQGLIPLLLVWPTRASWPRMLALGANAATQIGFGLSFRLGHFPWTACALLLAFIPGDMWRRWGVPPPAFAGPPPASMSVVSRVQGALAAVSIALALLWNLGEAGATFMVAGSERDVRSTFAGAVARALGLEQRWAMFSPNPQTEDGWIVVAGRISASETVDLTPTLWSGAGAARAVQGQKPASIADALGPHRWAMLLLDASLDPKPAALEGIARYACRQWNEERPQRRVARVALVFMRFEHLPGHRTTPVEPRVLFVQPC